jgi:hypothetical protein
MEAPRGKADIAPTHITLALDGGEWSVSHPSCATGTHWIGGWVGHRAGLKHSG